MPARATSQSFVSDVSEFFEDEVDNALSCSRTVKLSHLAIDKELNSGKALDLNIGFFLIGIDGCDVGDSFERFCGFLVFGGEGAAVSAPGGVELDQPDSCFNLAEVGDSQLFDC